MVQPLRFVQKAGELRSAHDGRIKPDLSNFYDATYTTDWTNDTSHADFHGTSAATPNTAGHFGLLFQMWADGVFSGSPGKKRDVFDSRPHAATAKALMINTAWQYPFPSTAHDITRAKQGWGRPNIRTLYDLARNDGWKLPLIIDQSNVIQPFGTHTYNVNVPGNASDTLWFKATLVYPDPKGPTSSSKHRINDLTLRVTAPDGTVYWGNNGLSAGVWSTPGGGPNDVDTVENVFLPDGSPGEYKVEVRADAIVEDGHLATTALDAVYSLVVTRALGSCAAPPAGMIGWWSFDGPAGAVSEPLPDIQGGHNGQPVGQVSRFGGQVRQGARFGSDSFVEVAHDPALDITGDFTIDAWYTLPPGAYLQGDDEERAIASKLEDASGYSLLLEQDKNPTRFTLTIADGAASSFSMDVNQTLTGWHHVAVTVDRDSPSGGRWYFDGVEVAQFDPTARSGSLANAAPLRMGQVQGSGPWALDEVEIFNRALTADEIKSIYQAGSAGKCKLDVWVEDTPYNDSGSAPDTGEEPDANMIGKPIWASRALWVRNDGSPCAGSMHLDHTNPVFGNTNTICVEVKNRSVRPSMATTVEVYFAPASSGLPWTPGIWTLAGSQVISVPASGSQTAQIAWTNVPDPANEPDGHFCMIVRLVTAEDPMTYPEGTNLGANVVNNNNIAWRNVNVLGLEMKTEEMARMRVRNVHRERELVDLTFRGAEEFIAEGGTLLVDLGSLFEPWRASGGKGSNFIPADGTRVRLRALPATLEGISMAGGEERVLALTAEAREPLQRKGTSNRYTVEVVEFIRGVEIGGVSYSIAARGLDADTDRDGIPDVQDPDDDNDGAPDAQDTNPLDPRTGGTSCPRGSQPTILRGLHYPIREYRTCAAATAAAISKESLNSPRYRAACGRRSVRAARVVSCHVSPPLSRGYVVADVEVCCR